MESNLAIIINRKDNVATALSNLKSGEAIDIVIGGEHITTELIEDIPIYHKFALVDFMPGDRVFKYGEIIGEATSIIKKGQHVHVHNITSLRSEGNEVSRV